MAANESTTEFLASAQIATLCPEQFYNLLRIKRTRRSGFVPSLADVDCLLELIGLLLGGAQ